MAKSRAQQAAIAISMKKAGKKPKSAEKGTKYSDLSDEEKKKLRSDRRKGNIVSAIINLPRFIGSKAKKVKQAGDDASAKIPKGAGKEVTKANIKKVAKTAADMIKKRFAKKNMQEGGKAVKKEDVSKLVKELMSKIGKTSGKLSKAQAISQAFGKGLKKLTEEDVKKIKEVIDKDKDTSTIPDIKFGKGSSTNSKRKESTVKPKKD
tara:strand:- start:3569 stop:4189 length:621 start_codon:yes stop_codon:yes gene_type:complete